MSDTDSMFYVILNIIFEKESNLLFKDGNLRVGNDGEVVVFLFFYCLVPFIFSSTQQ